MVEVKDSPYVSQFSELEKSWGDAWHAAGRREAIRRFEELGFPTRRQERWKYTNVTALARTAFSPIDPASTTAPGRESLGVYDFSDLQTTRLVFLNGRFEASLSVIPELPDRLHAGSLGRALEEGSQLVRGSLGRLLAEHSDHAFVALNEAFFEDGAFVHVRKGAAIDQPVHLLFLTTESADATVSYPRILVVLEESAQLTLIEDYASLGGQTSLTNSAVEITVGENAALDHYRLLRESRASSHVSAVSVRQERCSRFSSFAACVRGKFVRNDVAVLLDGEDCECTLYGIVVAAEEQHVDNQTRIVHRRANCRSWEVYKTILGDRATGVFNGKIYVHPEAQKTDAKQTNMSLLLSERAEMNSKPELEIYADDVRCTHGATVGQLDDEALYYLRSRGIDRDSARNILTFAFARDVLSQIRPEALREVVQDLVAEKLPRGDLLEDFR
ncbi:MAG: Fe-S cluster assembly protein SufD [Planctomycetota bacterium]|nr:Fe-S cluster assembly protein SufD [Planctomycetota bacterium]